MKRKRMKGKTEDNQTSNERKVIEPGREGGREGEGKESANKREGADMTE